MSVAESECLWGILMVRTAGRQWQFIHRSNPLYILQAEKQLSRSGSQAVRLSVQMQQQT